MIALWVILFIIGVPIVVVFWIVVALIIVAVHESKESREYPHINKSLNPQRIYKPRKRSAKQTIIKLR